MLGRGYWKGKGEKNDGERMEGRERVVGRGRCRGEKSDREKVQQRERC